MTPTRPGPWPCRIVALAVRLLPADRRVRYGRELGAELYGMTPWQQLRHSIQVLVHAPALGAALRAAGPTTVSEDLVTAAPRRPLRCRLHRHDWDDRENPETHEWYQICLRCGAYHERPQAAPGAGAAGVAGGGIF